MNKIKVFIVMLLVAVVAGFMPLYVKACEENNDQSSETEETCDLPEPTPTEEPELPTPPDFPACNSYSENGDWEHYDYGWHQIVGDGLLEGSDDVYTFGDNFVQCFCGTNGDGIETYWWRSDTVVDGWFVENGLVWNLGDYQYLAKNVEYDCSPEEPTPTPTPTDDGDDNGDGGDTPICPESSPTASPELQAFYTSDTSVMLTWNSVGPVTHYMIRYGTSSGNYQYGSTNIGNVISYEVKDLDANQTYFFQLAGVNECAAGHWSNEISPSRGRILAAHTTVDAGFGSGLGIIALISGVVTGIFVFLSKLTKRRYIFEK